MKRTNWMIAVLALAALGLAGCHKSEKMPDSEQISGVSIDMPKLQQTFSGNTNDQIRRLLVDASMGLRYGDYVKSMMALEQISSQPDITEAQKKVVTDVIEQEKKLAGSP